MAATAEALGMNRPVLEPNLLSQTATARRMGPERFKQIMRMAIRADVQAQFNKLFPNIANDPKSQERFESMRINVFEGDQLECYDLLKEAYGKPTLVEAQTTEPQTPVIRTMVVFTEHPIVDPSNFIG
jgi:hypothetical protein